MTINYSCVCRGTTILVSHQVGEGSYEDVIESMLPNIPSRNNSKTTYSSNNYSFHVLVDNGIIYICAADPSFGKQKPYTFLAEIKRRFQGGTLGQRAVTAGHNEFGREFGHVLAEQMEKGSKGPTGQMAVLQSQVDEVKGVMSQNIEKVLERGERLEDLIDKTDELQANSMAFQTTAKKIRKKYWWKNTKMTIILVCVALVVILIIVLVILFSTGVLPPDSSSGSKSVTTTVKP